MVARLLSALFFAIVLTTLPPGARAAEPIHVALSAPLTGNFAEYGQNFRKAIDLAVQWINSGGGIKGRPVVIVVGDSRADPKEAAALCTPFAGG